MKPCAWLLFFTLTGIMLAHPMGNFSVSHYSRIEVSGAGTEIRYVLDLAEIPSFEILQQWGLSADSPREQLDRKADEQARGWAGNLAIEYGRRTVEPHFEG